MNVQSKNAFKIRTFHQKLVIRLAIAGSIVAAVFGWLTWWSQGERIIDNVTDRAIRGTRLFNDQISYLINSTGWLDKGAVDRELKAFIGETTRVLRDREFHLIYVSVVDPKFGLLADIVDDQYPLIEALRAEAKELEKKLTEAQDSLYQVHRLDGNFFILTATPLVNNVGSTVAYVESIFAVSPTEVVAARQEIKWTVLGVIGIVLVTTILLYPTIVSLIRRVSQMAIDLLNSNLETIQVLGSAIAKRDSDTDAHNYRVTVYAVRLAEAVGLDQKKIRGLIKGAFLHDVGKIGVRDSILLKPGRLDKDEYEIMKTHVKHGLDIVKRSAWLNDATDVVGYHHEKFNGEGYFENLAGEKIPIAARIFAIADVFDALTSERPYKKAFPLEQAISILKEGKETHFDPQLLDAFIGIAPDLYRDFSGREDNDLKEYTESIRYKYFEEDAEIQLLEN